MVLVQGRTFHLRTAYFPESQSLILNVLGRGSSMQPTIEHLMRIIQAVPIRSLELSVDNGTEGLVEAGCYPVIRHSLTEEEWKIIAELDLEEFIVWVADTLMSYLKHRTRPPVLQRIRFSYNQYTRREFGSDQLVRLISMYRTPIPSVTEIQGIASPDWNNHREIQEFQFYLSLLRTQLFPSLVSVGIQGEKEDLRQWQLLLPNILVYLMPPDNI